MRGRKSVEIEISNRLPGVGRFLRLFHRLLKFFLQQVGGVSLCFDRLLEDRLAAAILLTHGARRRFHIVESLRFHRGRMGNYSTRSYIDLQQRIAAGAGYFEVGGIFRHLANHTAKTASPTVRKLAEPEDVRECLSSKSLNIRASLSNAVERRQNLSASADQCRQEQPPKQVARRVLR